MKGMQFSWEKLDPVTIQIEIQTPVTRIGTLYRLTAAILITDLDILSGDVQTITDEGGTEVAVDRFVLRSLFGGPQSPPDVPAKLGVLMETLLQEEADPDQILQNAKQKIPAVSGFLEGSPEIVFEHDDREKMTTFYIETISRQGLLFHLSRILYQFEIDIKRADIRTDANGTAQDTFKLQYKGNVLGDHLSKELERVIIDGK